MVLPTATLASAAVVYSYQTLLRLYLKFTSNSISSILFVRGYCKFRIYPKPVLTYGKHVRNRRHKAMVALILS